MKPLATLLLPLAVLLGLPPLPAAAEDQGSAGATSPWYAVGLATTTVAYRPHGGAWDGAQEDLTLNAGLGRFVSSKLAVELDLGFTMIEGEQISTSVTPGLIWAFHPNVYGAARFIVPFSPDSDFVLSPGIGVTHTFEGGIAPLLEVNATSAVGHGEADLGIAVTVGLLVSF